MKPTALLVALGLLSVEGCSRPTPDEISLQAYTNIPPGTVVVAQMRLSGNLVMEVTTTNEYVLVKIEDGFVTLRGTNGLSLGYAGSLIRSIELKEPRK